MLELSQTPAGCEVKLSGDLTIRDAQDLFSELRPVLQQDRDVIMNMAGVTRMDASILQILLVARKHLKACGRALTLVDHSDAVLSALRLTGLNGQFNDPVVEFANPSR